MKKRTKSKRNLLSKKKKIVKILIFTFCLVVCLVFLSKYVSARFNKFFVPPNRPQNAGVQIDAPYNLEASVILNNENNTHVFTDSIIPLLNKAKKSVELAMYSFDSVVLKDKIYELNRKGIDVTLIFDKGKTRQHDIVFEHKPPGIKFIYLGKSSGITDEDDMTAAFMHHKFVIIDRGIENAVLCAGSWNWTFAQELYDPSFVVKTKDKFLIECFGNEFDRLARNVSGTAKFKDENYKPWAYNIKYENCFVDVWWSPGFKANSVKYKLLDLINSAKKNIKIMIWQMNDMAIAKALLKKAQNGIDVSLIVDDRGLWEEFSVMPYLQSRIEKFSLTNFTLIDDVWSRIDFNNELDPELKQKHYNPYFHHHTLIVDSEIATCGTENWTAKGNFANDETTIITDNKLIVKSFLATFDYFFKKLHNKNVNAFIKDGKLIIDNLNTNAGNTVIVVAQKTNTEARPFVAIKRPVLYPKFSFNIGESFENKYLSVFIVDKNGNVVANKRFWKISL